jgi:hypothetical protein
LLVLAFRLCWHEASSGLQQELLPFQYHRTFPGPTEYLFANSPE